VVVRYVALTGTRVQLCRYNANQLHHSSIFVGKDVAMEYKGPCEVRIGLSDDDSAGSNISARILIGNRYGDHILPQVVTRWNVLREGVKSRWGVDFNYLKWIDVNVEGMSHVGGVILKYPVLKAIEGHALVNDRPCLFELLVIDHQVRQAVDWIVWHALLEFDWRTWIGDIVLAWRGKIEKKLRHLRPDSRKCAIGRSHDRTGNIYKKKRSRAPIVVVQGDDANCGGRRLDKIVGSITT